MNAKQARRCRGAALREAKRSDLWGRMHARLVSGWWKRLLVKFFPKTRKRYADWVGRWYKSVVKHAARQTYADMHDRDRIAFNAQRKRMRRKEAARKMKEAKSDTPWNTPEPSPYLAKPGPPKSRVPHNKPQHRSWP